MGTSLDVGVRKRAYRCRRWVFTCFKQDYVGVDGPKLLCDSVHASQSVRYFVAQVERAPTTDHLHVQAYVEFFVPVVLSRLRSLVPDAHFESARGTSDECLAYCTKEETYVHGRYVFGTPLQLSGKSSALTELLELAKSGASDYELLNADPSAFVRFQRALPIVRDATARSRRVNVSIVEFVYGPTSTGKTTGVYQRAEETSRDVFLVPEGSALASFNGYSGEHLLLFDDFTNRTISTSLLLKIMRPPGQRPLQVNTKGSFVYLEHNSVTITSNFAVDNLWPDETARSAICARINSWWYHPELGKAYHFDDYKSFKDYTERPSYLAYMSPTSEPESVDFMQLSSQTSSQGSQVDPIVFDD